MSFIVPALTQSIIQDSSKGILTFTATSAISGLRCIKVESEVPSYCDAAATSNLGKLVGLSLNSVVPGDVLQVQYDGIVVEPTWALSPGAVYVGTSGQITQDPTGLSFVQNIGEAISATSILVNIKLPQNTLRAASSEVINGDSGATPSIDWRVSSSQRSNLTANCIYTLVDPLEPYRLSLTLVQGGVGSFTATWPASVRWEGGTAPTLSTAVGAVDIISFYFDGTNYYGSVLLNMS